MTPAEQERAAVVAWLRKQSAARFGKVGNIMSGDGPQYDTGRATGYAHAADLIERGAHLRNGA